MNTLSFATLILHFLFCTVVLSAPPTFDQVFEVAKGNVPGSCDAHLPLLQKMFQDIQTINANTIAQLQTDKYNDNAETRKLLKSLFGIDPTNDDKEPTGGLDMKKLVKVRRAYLFHYILYLQFRSLLIHWGI